MNPIQLLQQKLTNKFPDAQITLDVPKDLKGVWSLDAILKGHHVGVEWKHDKGFGVFSGTSHGYGEKADEVYADLESTLERASFLLRRRRRTIPPEAVRLRELREELGFSQEELARRLGVRQGAVSKVENRSDVLVSTLYTVVRAMGGRLVIKVAFPDNSERELKFENLEV
jgi:DNA-binding XRE family transcriptional regulator